MAAGGLVILAILGGIINLFSLTGILWLIVSALYKEKSQSWRIGVSFISSLSILALLLLVPGDINFMIELWWLFPSIFAIVLIYSIVSWLKTQRKDKKKYLWLIFGIAGMYILPFSILFGARIFAGDPNWFNAFLGSTIFVIFPLALFVIFPAYLTGFLTGALIGYSIDEGITKTIRKKLGFVLADILAVYQGIYLGLIIRPKEISLVGADGSLTISVFLDTILWATAGFILGWLIAKYFFKEKK